MTEHRLKTPCVVFVWSTQDSVAPRRLVMFTSIWVLCLAVSVGASPISKEVVESTRIALRQSCGVTCEESWLRIVPKLSGLTDNTKRDFSDVQQFAGSLEALMRQLTRSVKSSWLSETSMMGTKLNGGQRASNHQGTCSAIREASLKAYTGVNAALHTFSLLMSALCGCVFKAETSVW